MSMLFQAYKTPSLSRKYMRKSSFCKHANQSRLISDRQTLKICRASHDLCFAARIQYMCGSSSMRAAQQYSCGAGITQAVRMKHIQHECGTSCTRAAQLAGEQYAGSTQAAEGLAGAYGDKGSDRGNEAVVLLRYCSGVM